MGGGGPEKFLAVTLQLVGRVDLAKPNSVNTCTMIACMSPFFTPGFLQLGMKMVSGLLQS